MTPYEMLDMGQSNFSNSLTILQLLIGVWVGYLVAAYNVGAKLTTLQVSVLNITFVGFCSTMTLASLGFISSATAWVALGRATGEAIQTASYDLRLFSVVLSASVTGLCLYFMYAMRNPKSE